MTLFSPKSNAAPPAKSERKAKRLTLQDRADRVFQKLFGLTAGWSKSRNIVENNYRLGLEYLQTGHINDAVMRFKIVTWINPKYAEAWYYLGCALLASNKRGDAKAAFARALRLKPDYEEALYMQAMAGGKKTPVEALPVTMPLSLAQSHFDALAMDYDVLQLDELQYQGHVLLADAVHEQLVTGRIDHEILELGVGTGLCGTRLRDVAATLTGVDMSQPMLSLAMTRQDAGGRKLYDSLILRTAQSYLPEVDAKRYDVVIAANLFSYIGALEDIFTEIARILKPGGLFGFTVDKRDGEGFRFDTESGRFAFSTDYLRILAKQAGLQEIRMDEVALYPQSMALLCLFRK